MVPRDRVRSLNRRAVRETGEYVLYWMTAHRRLGWSFALDRAVEEARRLGRPLLILEALRVDYPWASARLHRFVLDGMREHAEALEGGPVTYYPYVEPEKSAGSGLLAALSQRACLVVTDDFPAFFLPRMAEAAAAAVPVLMEAVDSNGLMPLSVTPGAFSAAVFFRQFLQRSLPTHLLHLPDPAPLSEGDLAPAPPVPEEIARRWPPAAASILKDDDLGRLPIDHDVAPVGLRGGTGPARARLETFLEDGLSRYAEERKHPDSDASSGLSPWLHWGHLSAHEVFKAVTQAEEWSPQCLSHQARGAREGWWGMSASAEAFLDQLITWRELGFVFCWHRAQYDRFESLPAWAIETLDEHAADPREHTYTLEQFAAADTHDALWNAAQNQLRREGSIHNYLRMLWGKKILEWTPHPRVALEIMVELNNRFALDGRDPNSYSGIFWVLGRFDRGWPRRPIYGKVRSMSSDSTLRKTRVTEYLGRYREAHG